MCLDPVTKACSACGRVLPLSSFYRDRRRRDGRYSQCKSCHNEACRRSREANARRNAIRPLNPALMKTCGRCGEDKPAAKFARNRNAPDGRHWVCKACTTEEPRVRWARDYGIAPEDVDQMRRMQGDRCAICRSDLREVRPHIDHDHQTGRVRGLLCFQCNAGLGLLNDDASVLRAAARYLARSNGGNLSDEHTGV